MLTDNEIQEIASTLHHARLSRTELAPLGEKWGERFELQDAYKVQWAGIQKRLSDGETLMGMKMGLTSEAKRKQMNLHEPVYGFLTQEMLVTRAFDPSKGIHPKIEPEIGVRLSQDISSEISFAQAGEYVDELFAALEILDSRYRGFKYFSLPDVVADNSSSAHAVLGSSIRYSDWLKQGRNLAELSMHVTVNGKLAQSVKSNEISGHPLQSVVELSRLCARFGQTAKKGWIVLLGAAAPALPLEKSMKVELEVESIGTCTAETL